MKPISMVGLILGAIWTCFIWFVLGYDILSWQFWSLIGWEVLFISYGAS